MKDRKKFLLFVYWLGVVGDAVSTVAMLFPAQFFKVDQVYLTPATRGAFAAGAALMLGWTVLLFWASLEPFARCGILLITAIPVIPGLAASLVYAYRAGCMPLASAVFMWCTQIVLFVLMLVAYRMAGNGGSSASLATSAGK